MAKMTFEKLLRESGAYLGKTEKDGKEVDMYDYNELLFEVIWSIDWRPDVAAYKMKKAADELGIVLVKPDADTKK